MLRTNILWAETHSSFIYDKNQRKRKSVINTAMNEAGCL